MKLSLNGPSLFSEMYSHSATEISKAVTLDLGIGLKVIENDVSTTGITDPDTGNFGYVFHIASHISLSGPLVPLTPLTISWGKSHFTFIVVSHFETLSINSVLLFSSCLRKALEYFLLATDGTDL